MENSINKNIRKEFNKLKSGDIDNIIEIGKVIDGILEKIDFSDDESDADYYLGFNSDN